MNSIEIKQYVDLPPVDDDSIDNKGTKSLGCGNSFISGRCMDGSNPENCVYEMATSKGATSCSGLF